jgi:hypothetical protein
MKPCCEGVMACAYACMHAAQPLRVLRTCGCTGAFNARLKTFQVVSAAAANVRGSCCVHLPKDLAGAILQAYVTTSLVVLTAPRP